MSVRSRTLLVALARMEEALVFYRDGRWNGDYPGGIEVKDGRRWTLDMGGQAERTLRQRQVRRALRALHDGEDVL